MKDEAKTRAGTRARAERAGKATGKPAGKKTAAAESAPAGKKAGRRTAAAETASTGRHAGGAKAGGKKAGGGGAAALPRVTALDLPLPEPLPDDVAELFDKCQSKLGLIPNVLVAYAHRPEKLRAFSLMYNDLMLGESGLTKLEREMIAVAVSAQNRCWYCQVAHGAAVRVLSGDPALGEALVMNWRVADLSERQRAMIGFAVRMTTESAAIGEADRQALREHGFRDADIWDIAAVAGFFNMSNRMASAVDMAPNADYHAMAR